MGNTVSKNHKPPIASWKPTPSEEFVSADGKLFICHFDKVLTETPGVRQIERFMIDKTSYQKQLGDIVRYTNYFINKYDTENELILAYFRIKYMIDKEKKFDIPPEPANKADDDAVLKYKAIRNRGIDAFAKFVVDELFSPDNHIAENIWQMVEDNYLDDIEKDDGHRKKNDGKEYLESLEFTNLHVKTMLAISCAMKVMSPIIFHFFYLRMIHLEKDTDLIYRFYRPLFDIFNRGANLYNKLYVYVKSRVSESSSINSSMFDKRLIFGQDKMNVINSFVKKVIISENMVKYLFPEKWVEKTGCYEENIVGFNKTIIKFQLGYFLKESYDKTLTGITNLKNSDGLSGADKLEMNLKKMDEGRAILADVNADLTSRYISSVIDIPVYQQEIDYLKDHWKPRQDQIKLINNYMAKFYGNMRDTNLLSREDVYRNALLIKKKLLCESGWVVDDGIDKMAMLPFVLTGNLEGKDNSRIIRGNAYEDNLENDPGYRQLIDNDYSLLVQIHPDSIKDIIRKFTTSRFTYVTPENHDLLGFEINYDEESLGAEVISFMHALTK